MITPTQEKSALASSGELSFSSKTSQGRQNGCTVQHSSQEQNSATLLILCISLRTSVLGALRENRSSAIPSRSMSRLLGVCRAHWTAAPPVILSSRRSESMSPTAGETPKELVQAESQSSKYMFILI